MRPNHSPQCGHSGLVGKMEHSQKALNSFDADRCYATVYDLSGSILSPYPTLCHVMLSIPK